MANTLSTYTLRHKFFSSNLQGALQNALVAEKICKVDNTDLKTIENPYITATTATIQAVAGTYTTSAMTSTDDALTVADEVWDATHVFEFESITAKFDLISDFLTELIYRVKEKIDIFVLNKILDIATGTYTTASGGFTTAANIPKIVGDLLGKVAGYASGVASSPFLVIESTDITGFVQLQVASGYNYADAALNNGFMANYAGVKIYVVRTGTFQTATIGTLTATNSGHRLFGISNLAVYAAPRGVTYKELDVPAGAGTGRLGKEVVAAGYIGATIWVPHRGLFVDITLA
jgi:hypothetical protein